VKLSKEVTLKSWQKAAIYLIAWLVPVVGLYCLADIVTKSIIFHIMYLMTLLPLATLIVTFMYTRRTGINPWLIIYMAAAIVTMYFGFGFNELNPDFIITNLICGFFGFGVGNIFKDEAAVAVQQDIDSERKKKRAAEERKYVSLIDTNPKTGEKSNIRKKRKRKV
jgi:hypothetical protein